MRAGDCRLRAAVDVRPLVRALRARLNPLLLLWDIDGTLLQRASREHAVALKRALHEVHGVDVEALKVDAAGRTDAAIARSLLEASGVGREVVDARSAEVMAATVAAYEQLCPPDLSRTVAPGIADVLKRLGARPSEYRFSLVTGNFEAVARRKLAAAGIGSHFPAGQGGFGSDAEARQELPGVARARAGGWPRERTVVIGDTPRDIACARADGVRVVAVATGPYAADQLAAADAVVPGALALVDVLDALAAAA